MLLNRQLDVVVVLFSHVSLRWGGLRSAVLGRGLGRQRSAYRGAHRLIVDYGVARAAYDEAIKRRPGRTITPKQRRDNNCAYQDFA